jgi:hypothetical protein
MLNHKEILKTCLFKTDAGELIAINRNNGAIDAVVAKMDSIDKRYFNLLSASSIMYESLSRMLEVIETILANLKLNNNSEAIFPFEAIKTNLVLTMRVATEGIATVSADLESKKNVN